MRAFSLTVEQVSALVNPVRTQGSYASSIIGLGSLDHAIKGDLSFLGDPRYEKQLSACQASVILVPEKSTATPKEGQLYLHVKNPSIAFAVVCERIEKMLWPLPQASIHPSAVVDREANVSPKAYIGPLCVIEAFAEVHEGAVLHSGVHVGMHACVGANSELKPKVTIMPDCSVGQRCVLHAGVVVGSDGYGFAFVAGAHRKIPQIGRVVIEDDVEIGANTTIDRARFGITRIGQGTKIDNLVQVGHNVNIGKHCLIVAQVGIAGSSTLEDYVVVGGQAGISGHITIGTQTQIAAQSGVIGSVEAKSFVWGNPAQDQKKAYRVLALSRRLPELFKRMTNIEELLKIDPKASKEV